MSKTATAPQARTAKPSPFAAAMTVTPRAEKKDGEDDDDRSPKEDESDEDFAKRMKADKDCPDADKQKEGESDEDYAKRMRKAEDEAEEEEVAEPTDDEKKAAAFRDGFQACNTRWETVLKSPEAAGKGALACELLAGTKLTAKRVISALGAMSAGAPDGGKGGLSKRMSENAVVAPAPSAPAKATNDKGVITAEAVMAAAKKARGEK